MSDYVTPQEWIDRIEGKVNRILADQRIKELAKLPKWQLAQMHKSNGGLMPLADYQKWTKDELLSAVIEDEGLATA